MSSALHVAEHGAGEPTCVLWLHGALVAGWMWDAQVAALPGYHHLVPDLPGVGRSAAAGTTGVDGLATAMLELIDQRAENKPVHVVGLSLGAVVALRLLAQAPHRCTSAILSGPLARPVTGPLVIMQHLLLALYGRAAGARVVARALGLPEDVRAAFLETARATPPETYRQLLPELYARPLPAQALDTIDIPILLVTGSRDTRITCNSVRDLLATLPAAQAYWADGLGHQWNAEDGERFSRMVAAWLAGDAMPAGLSPVAPDGTAPA